MATDGDFHMATDMLAHLQQLPRDAELLALEAGCEFCRGVGVSDAWP
jgi:hypothetical protein